MKQLVIIFGLGFTLANCATPPKQHYFDKSRTINQPFERTWQNTIQFFTGNNIPIKTIDKSSGVIYAEKLNTNQQEGEKFADCGASALELVLQTKISLNIFLQKIGPNQTKGTINTQFSQVREFDRRRREVTCNSRGTLEQRLLNALSN